MTSEAKVETLPKSIRSSGGTVPQMFGIYRARTPDEKLDPPSPGRHTRALFLSAVVTGVALVVGLTLIDVSTNSSNLKSTPVLHLTRHRQDLFVVDARTSEAPDIQGTVEEINDTASEPFVTTVVNITDIATTEVSNDEKSENSGDNNDKVRTARTQLFPIESLKRHRTQYVKDYFVDGKHDPQSLGYYILQKQNGEYYLRNYSEPIWGTRIRRRFSNRMYPPPPLGADPYQFARRSDNFENRYHFYGGPSRIDRFRQPPIDRQDHGKKNLQTMTTLRKYFNPYSKRVETGLPQTYSAFGRSDKPFAPTPITDGEDSDPPHYQFTPIPVFSDSYAQLDPYKNNREIKSMKDIVKYLTTSTSLPRFERTTTTITTTQATITSLESFQNEEGEKEEDSFEDLLTTSSAAKVTRLKPPSNTNFNWKEPTYQPPPKRVNRKRGMRISGTYRMPIEPEDLRTGASGLVETLVPPPMHPFMFIANTTEPDPFAKFRPLDPSEINQLAAPRPLRPPGSMFMNNIRPISGKPNQYFPKPPHDRNPVRQGISLNPNHSPSHTVALFKQNGSSGRQKYHQSGFGKKKPVSVTLDIYPMTMDSEQGYQQDEGIGLPIKYDEKPLNDEWSPRNPDTSNGQQMDSQGSDNHMVVHLNVYPKGITSNLRTGIGRQAFWNPPLPIAAYQKRAMSESPSNTTASPTKTPEKTNSTIIEDDILDAPFLDYNFDDLPPASYNNGEENSRKNKTTDDEYVSTSGRTKEEDKSADNSNSISQSQRYDSAFNRTDNYYEEEEFSVNGDGNSHKTENFLLDTVRQSGDSSSGNNNTGGSESAPVDSNEETFRAESNDKNVSQLVGYDNVAALKDDNRFVESTSESTRYQYRLLTAPDNNVNNTMSDSNQVTTDSSVEVVRNYDDSNHKLTQINGTDYSEKPILNDYDENKREATYDYDLNDAPYKDEYQDYFENDSDSKDYQKQ